MAFKNNYLFDYLGNILTKKDNKLYLKHINDPDFLTSYSVYMVTTYLSMSPNAKVRKFILDNQYYLEKMPQKIHYKILLDNIDKCYNSFIKFIK